MSTPPQAEKELQRLRRLPENRICPNCQKQETGFGFQAVCWAYKTFICSDCKSSHQAYSHRCKSVSMSNWTMLEVQAMDEKNCGGNRHALKRWLANVPESVRATPESHIDVKKSFVDRAYNKKEWERTSPAPMETGTSATPKAPTRPVASAKSSQGRSNHVATMDLLDVDAVSSPPPALAAAPVPVCNLLDNDFFNPLPASQIGASTASDVTSSGSFAFSFVNSSSNDSAGASPSGFSFINSNSNVATGPSPSRSAFSFVAASQGSQQSSQAAPQAIFDPLGMPSTMAPTPQLQNFAPMNGLNNGIDGWQGMQNQQQPASSQGAMQFGQGQMPYGQWQMHGQMQCGQGQMQNGQGQMPCDQGQMQYGKGQVQCGQGLMMMNSYMASGPSAIGQPWQASMQASMSPGAVAGPQGMVAGVYTGMTNVPIPQSAAPVLVSASRPAPLDQSSSFDPFDPFAPDPISVGA